MRPVTAGAHICSPRADAHRAGEGGASVVGSSAAPWLLGSRGDTPRGGRVPAPRAGLGMGARRLRGDCVSEPGAPGLVIDGPPGDSATGARDLPGGARPLEPGLREGLPRVALRRPFSPSPLSYKGRGLRFPGPSTEAGDPAERPDVGVWGPGSHPCGEHKGPDSHSQTTPVVRAARPSSRRGPAPGSSFQPQRVARHRSQTTRPLPGPAQASPSEGNVGPRAATAPWPPLLPALPLEHPLRLRPSLPRPRPPAPAPAVSSAAAASL